MLKQEYRGNAFSIADNYYLRCRESSG